jgi:hypothetical protein
MSTVKEKGYYSLIKTGELLKLALFFTWDVIVIAKWLHQKSFSEQDSFCVNYTHIHVVCFCYFTKLSFYFIIHRVFNVSKFILKCLLDFVMSLRISLAVKDKLTLWKVTLVLYCFAFILWLIGWYYACKSRCSRWFYAMRTFNLRDLLVGARPAQTYDLPNSGIQIGIYSSN